MGSKYALEVQTRSSELGLSASTLNDIEKMRIGIDNRIRIATLPTDTLDKDGKSRGLGLSPESDTVSALVMFSADVIAPAEKQATAMLQDAMKHLHPLGPWADCTPGIGYKQLGRLLNEIGDPYWHALHNRPRRVSELWAYCGLDVRDGHAPRRKAGKKSNWNTNAKTRAYLISERAVKMVGTGNTKRSPYRDVYDDRRGVTANRVHTDPCQMCGTKGKPAPEATLWMPRHQQADALRVMSKRLLLDLWLEMRRLHAEHDE